MVRNPLIIEGLRGARKELEKVAMFESAAARGLGLGSILGAFKAVGSGASHIAGAEKAILSRAAGKATKEELEFLAKNPKLEALFDTTTNKMKPFSANKGAYMSALGPQIAKDISYTAGAGGGIGLGVDAMKGVNKYKALNQYVPYAAAGGGALLGMAALKK